ncbi:MAG TPA: ABC transporter permease [Vicinamibacterales bacterium]|nr:ABC transporter permease [Vicinamibacterales bacterium]
MSLVARQTAGRPPAPRRAWGRPPWPLACLVDAGLAAGALLLSYRLRFVADQLAAFLPGAWAIQPLVVGCQLAALALARAYSAKVDLWPLRVLAGVIAGSAMAGGLTWAVWDFAGVSRMALASQAVLFSMCALGWRSLWLLRARTGEPRELSGMASDMVDRAQEVTTVAGVVASLFGYRELLKNLVLKDLKLKYRGSVFGFLWSLANPLLMIVVYTVAFTYILRIRTEGFVFYLILGLLSWSFFSSSASMATGAIVDNSGLLKSVFFPRAILPIATVLFNLAQYLLTILVFLPVMLLWYKVPLSPPMLLYPVVLGLQVVFTIGAALILATGTAFFRDVRHLLEVALAVLFWTTPILYELRQVPEGLRVLVLLSPVSPFVVGYQKLFYYREWPEPTWWLVAGLYALVTFVVGAALFLAFEDRFAEQV